MKITKYFFYYVLLIGLLSSCLKDEGNYTYLDLPEFYVDTVGTKVRFEVYQSQGKVTITPNIVGETSDLKYQWRLYVSNGVFDTLSRTKNIDAIVTRSPGFYTLEFEATKPSGIKAMMQYSVVVLSPIPSGWMVAYEKGSGQTDVDVIRCPEFISNAKDTVMRAVYAFRNGSSIPGKPVSIAYTSGMTYIYTTTGGVNAQNTDFAFIRDFAHMFAVSTPSVVAPQACGTSLGFWLINDNELYWATSNVFVGVVTVDDLGYSAAPYVFYHYAKQVGFYDQTNMRFLYLDQWKSQASKYVNANSTARFNLNNIGKKLLFVDRGFETVSSDPYKYAIFKDVTGNGRYLYIINTSAPLTPDVALIDISSAPDILSAKFFAVGNMGPNGHYATDTKVYYYQFNKVGNSITTPVIGFQAPSGESITSMILHKGHGFSSITDDSKFMYIATWNEATKIAKVYLYSVNITSGVLSSTPLKTWTVGGKVADMAFKTN